MKLHYKNTYIEIDGTSLTQKTFYAKAKDVTPVVKNTDITKIEATGATGHATNFVTFPNCKILTNTSGTVLNNAFSGLINVTELNINSCTVRNHGINDLESLKELTLPSTTTIKANGIVNAPYINKLIVKGASSKYEKNCILTGKKNIKCVDLRESSITISLCKEYFSMCSDNCVFVISNTSQHNSNDCLDGNQYAILYSNIKTIKQSNGTFDVFLYNKSDGTGGYRNVYIPEYDRYYINVNTGLKETIFINEVWHLINNSYLKELFTTDSSRHTINFYNTEAGPAERNFSKKFNTIEPTICDIPDNILYNKVSILINNLNLVINSTMYYSFFKACMDNGDVSCTLVSGTNHMKVEFNLNNNDMDNMRNILSNGKNIYEQLSRDVFSTGASITEIQTEDASYRYKDYHTTLNSIDFLLKRTPVAEFRIATTKKPKDYATCEADENKYYPISYSYWEYYDGDIVLIKPDEHVTDACTGLVKAYDSSLNFVDSDENVLYSYSDGSFVTEVLQDAKMTGYYSFEKTHNDYKTRYKKYYYYKYSDRIETVCECNKLYACYYLYKCPVDKDYIESEDAKYTKTTHPNININDMQKTDRFKYTFDNQQVLSIKSFDVENNKIYLYNNKNTDIVPLNAIDVHLKLFEIRYDGIYRSCLGYTMRCSEYNFLAFDFIPNKDTNLAYIKNEDSSSNKIITDKYNYSYLQPIKYAYLNSSDNDSIIDSSMMAENIYANYVQCDYCYSLDYSNKISSNITLFNDYMFPSSDTVYVFDIYSCNNGSHMYDSSNFIDIFYDYMPSVPETPPPPRSFNDPLVLTEAPTNYRTQCAVKRYIQIQDASCPIYAYLFKVRYYSRVCNNASPYEYILEAKDYGPGVIYRVVVGLYCFYVLYKNKDEKLWTLENSITTINSSTFKADFIENGYSPSQTITLYDGSTYTNNLMYSRMLVCNNVKQSQQCNYNNFKYDNITVGNKTRDVKPYEAIYKGDIESKSYVMFDTCQCEYIQNPFFSGETMSYDFR